MNDPKPEPDATTSELCISDPSWVMGTGLTNNRGRTVSPPAVTLTCSDVDVSLDVDGV
jgi:hypothetical protein